MLAFGKASASGSLKLAKGHATKLYSTAPAPAPINGNGTHSKPVSPATQRELFMNVLNANATKRDAKQYLARFKPAKSATSQKLSPIQEERNARHRRDQDRLDRVGVNLGGLYAPARAIADSPQFSRQNLREDAVSALQQQIHVALVCLRAPETLDDATLDGVALTLSQLVKLDMRILLVLDCGNQSQDTADANGDPINLDQFKKTFAKQSERLNNAVSQHSPEGARMVTGAIEAADQGPLGNGFDPLPETLVSLPQLLLEPLKRGVIPIVPTLAYTTSGQLVQSSAPKIMSALSIMLSGLHGDSNHRPDDGPATNTSLDRIIVLDSAGGIPSKARGDGAHVLINLEQEFDDIQGELIQYGNETPKGGYRTVVKVYEKHRSNLAMVRKCLAMLPSASSALIISPQEVACSSQTPEPEASTIGAGTRRQKNTLIHNLLTNKPSVSSSLPVARMQSTPNANGEIVSMQMPGATLVKRGMPLTIIPAADRGLGWQTPIGGTTPLSLEDDPRVDLSRLVHLIEDSFRRKLDVRHYLDRIQNRIAGLIVAGEYEGGAILTWEMPAGTNDPARLVPYLDKFAVLSSSQGSSGVADIVFQAMVRTCFPQGVCWRSRKDNPVNKWYFERSDGTWQIPGTNWTMFWTGKGVVEDEERWNDYVSVCTDVKPSWKDGRKPD